MDSLKNSSGNFRFLKPLNSKIKKYNLFGFDIETYSDKNIFYCASIVSKNSVQIFDNNHDVIKYFLDLCTRTNDNIVFATNLGFDFFGTFQDENWFNYCMLCFRSSELVRVQLIHPDFSNRKLIFLDTLNFARYPVRTLGKIIGMEKLKSPSFLGHKPQNFDEWEELMTYNVRDSNITYKFSEFLQDSFNKLGTELKTTIASTSMNLFRNKYLTQSFSQPNKEIIDFQKMAYYGGRTETFKRGKIENMNYYDYNSLYPAQFIKEYPNPNFRRFSKNDNSILKFEGVSKVEVECPYMKIPFLPYKPKDKSSIDGKLIFPYGKWIGYYSHVELRKAIEIGYKIKVLESVYYIKNCKPFEKFGIDLYNLRLKYKKDNNPFQLPIKILLNSLYGKFAQHYINTEIEYINKYDYDDIKEMIDDENTNLTIVNKFLYIERLNTKIPSFILPIFSIYVTAYARIQMYNLFQELGFNHVYYCDTDSVITDKTLKSSKELGKLKKEHSIDNGILIKPKVYGFVDNGKAFIRCKGVPRNNFKTYDDFLNFIDNPVVNYMKFIKFKQAIRSKKGGKLGKLDINQKITMNKTLLLNDDKRIWREKFNKNVLQNSNPIFVPKRFLQKQKAL